MLQKDKKEAIGDRCEKQGPGPGFLFISCNTTLGETWNLGSHVSPTVPISTSSSASSCGDSLGLPSS